MDNNILKQYLSEIKSSENTSNGMEYFEGEYKVGETLVGVVVELKKQGESEIIRFKAEKTYNFEVIPANCELFNKEVQDKYGITYNIYGHKNTFFLSKKQIIEDNHSLDMICEEVFTILKESILLFEKNCVNFMKKYTTQDSMEEHDLNPELKKGDFEDKFAAVVMEESGVTESFVENQKEVAMASLQRLAKKYSASIMDSEELSFFETHINDGVLKLQLKHGDSDIEIFYKKKEPESKGFALVSNAKATYPEFISYYQKNFFVLESFVTPDEYLPEIEEDMINDLLNAAHTCEQLTIEEESQNENSVVTDLKEIINSQMKDLQSLETDLDEREALIVEKEKKLQEKALRFEEEKKRQVDFLKKKTQELEKKDKELESLKKELETEKQAHEEEKRQYENQFENMVAELKRVRARLESSSNSGSDGSSMEVQKLELKIKAMVRSRAAMEEQLKKEIQASQEKSRQLLRDVQTKQTEIEGLQRDFKIKANQMFQEERDSYEKEIRELREQANITENDVNTDSFKFYLDEKTEFKNSVIQHGKDKEIISINFENYNIKIVFGGMLFADVTRTFKKAVDLKTVSAMNNKYMDIKFFLNDKKVVTARKYFSKHILNPDLAQIIRDLMGNFE